jgi:hypothetical protein
MEIEGCEKMVLSQHEATCPTDRSRLFLNGGSVVKWQVLCDTIDVGWSNDRCFSQRAAAFGIFALQQVAPTSAPEEHFAGGGNFETFGH